MTLAPLILLSLTMVSQSRPEPRLTCPSGASSVELPAPSGGKVLRCVDDTTGNPHGPEVWLRVNGFFWQRGTWEQGRRHGTWDRWYATGHHLSRVDYNLGQPVAQRCLSEQKRRDQTCTPDWMPLEWQPPAAPTSGAAPAVAPMPALPDE